MGSNGRPINHAETVAPQMPLQVVPQPVPTVVNMGQVQAPDGSVLIAVQVQTPVGTSVFFFPPDIARQLGVSLQRLGSAGDIILAG